MAEVESAQTKTKTSSRPRDWVLGGFFATLLGAFVGAALGGEGGALALIGTIPGTLMVSVGVIAKAVQIGIRTARD